MASVSQTRIGGWLLVALAWLIMSLLTSALVVAMYLSALFDAAMRGALFNPPYGALWPWGASLLTSLLVGGYSVWVTWLFFQRSRRLPRYYIIWLLLSVMLALKTFAFSPVADASAIRTLLVALLAASVLVPYFRRSGRVRTTFIAR